VRPQVNGILKKRLSPEGSYRSGRQPLYQIDDTLYQAAYSSATSATRERESRLTNCEAEGRSLRIAAGTESSANKTTTTRKQHCSRRWQTSNSTEANVRNRAHHARYTRIAAPITAKSVVRT
jgi:multidrug efflux pump subunit AcrA (membrane-fusion protein)